MKAFRDRVRSFDPVTIDRVLIVFLLAILVAETIIYLEGDSARLVAAAVLAAGIVTLIVRRTRPVAALVAVVVADTAAGFISPDFIQTTATPFLALMAGLYAVARHFDDRRAPWVCGITLAFSAVTTALGGDVENPIQYLWLLVLGGSPVLVGRTLLSRQRLQDEIRARTEELEREGEVRSNRAVEVERVRIAGELQAVIANGVSAMVVQAEAVPRVIAAGETERAGESLKLIEDTGRDALAEMRRLLGVLRHEGDTRSLAPQPTLGQAMSLADRAGRLGLEVALEIEGQRFDLPVGIDLAAYRVLEETLDVAARDGASNATIVIAYEGDVLHLEIRDDRTAPGPQADSLQRIRERLGLYGGRVQSTLNPELGEHRLVARLPVRGVAV